MRQAEATEIKNRMKTKSKTEIVIETCRILTIKSQTRYEPAWCQQCGALSQMVSADEAAVLSRVSSRTIYMRVEANELHFIETPLGLLLICANSLLK